jgi:predicted permease
VDATDASRQSSALDALNAAIPFAWSAAFVSQSVPTSLTVGQGATVQITMKNTGTTTWSANEITPPVRLGAQNPQDNTTWGTNREDVTFPVAPGMTISFSFAIRAPSTAGSYAFQWRMVQETVTWFGDFTPTMMINVTGT